MSSDITTRSTRDHVSGHSVGQCDTPVKELYYRFHTFTTCAKGRQEDVEESCEKGDRYSKEQKHQEPDYRPTPLQTHVVVLDANDTVIRWEIQSV